MNESVKDRLKYFLKVKGDNAFQLEKKCGFSNGYIANIRKSIQPDKLEQILNIYPTLNVTWLMTGDGEMEVVEMVDKKTGDESKVSGDVLLKALDEIAEQRKLVSRAQDQIDQLILITKTMADAMANKND